MPELPDITVYLDALRPRVVNQVLQSVRITSLFLLRTVEPPIEEAQGQAVADVSRLGKRIVLRLSAPTTAAAKADGQDADLFLVFHLMIAGRLR